MGCSGGEVARHQGKGNRTPFVSIYFFTSAPLFPCFLQFTQDFEYVSRVFHKFPEIPGQQVALPEPVKEGGSEYQEEVKSSKKISFF